VLRHLLTLTTIFLLTSGAIYSQNSTDSLNRIVSTGSDRDKWAALNQLADIYKNNDPQKGLNYSSEAISVAEKLSDEALQAKSGQQYAGLLFRLGNFNKSKEYYQDALKHYANISNDKGSAECRTALGGILYAQGNIAGSVQYYLDALRYYEDKKDNLGLVNIYTSLAGLYARQNSFSKAIEYNLKAISIYENSSNKLQALVIYDQIGNAYLKQNNYSKATEFFNKSLKAYTELNNKAGVASTLNQLGNINLDLEEYDIAEALFRKSYQLATSLKTPYLQVINLNDLARTMIVRKQYDKAIATYKSAILIAKPGDMKLELEEAYNGLSAVYKLTSQKEKASTFNALSSNLRDSLYNDSTLKKLSDLQLQYESEKKQQQIELLSKEQEMKNVELENERDMKRFLLIVTAIISLIFIGLIITFIQNKRYSQSLQRQKNELELMNAEIIQQKEKVDQLNSVKDRFFSIISHDLRNNLTTMKLYFDLVGNPNYVPSDNKEITQHISSSVENTIDLLENLLVWASAQIKGIPIHRQKLPLHSLGEENITLLLASAAAKEISIENNIHEEAIAFGDLDMINLVFRNLISNAIKFTPEKGKIALNSVLNSDNNECVISVSDNGIGISEENREKLFDQHLHPTTKGTGNEKGTGLGLLLCRDFIIQNKGRIWVESMKNEGTTFYFSLPLKNEEAKT